MITIEQIKPFCSDDETRPELGQPWIGDGFTWATDRRILVRLHCELEGVASRIKAPDGMHHWKKNAPELPENAEWVPLPAEIPKVEDEECDFCHDGVHDCGCGHSHDCAACDGSGNVPGTIHGMDVGNRILSEAYLAKIAALPNPLLFLGGSHGHPVLFKFDGGEGLLMPMTRKVP